MLLSPDGRTAVRLDLADAIGLCRRQLVGGEPGSGKSMFGLVAGFIVDDETGLGRG